MRLEDRIGDWYEQEIEMDRFQMAREEAGKEYEYVDRPRGSAKDSINLAVDTLCTLGPGLKDGVPLEGEPAELLLKIVSGAFSQYPDALALTQQAIQDRPSRAKAYVA